MWYSWQMGKRTGKKNELESQRVYETTKSSGQVSSSAIGTIHLPAHVTRFISTKYRVRRNQNQAAGAPCTNRSISFLAGWYNLNEAFIIINIVTPTGIILRTFVVLFRLLCVEWDVKPYYTIPSCWQAEKSTCLNHDKITLKKIAIILCW